MALSEEFVDAHIARWRSALRSEFFPHRKYWPTRLFHHAPLENAVAILRDGCLRARADEHNCHPRDVAAPGVIDTRGEAHERVRLYFRPKTPTQFSIEGIRKTGESRYGEKTHAPVLVMFALDSRSILASPDIKFSNKNMQLYGAEYGDTEQFFSQIPFGKVYHEGGTGGDRDITDARCAEVMPSSPLPLNDNLREIFFRSAAERDTALHLLGDQGSVWSERFFVSDELKVFQKDYTFVTFAELSLDGFVFQLNPRRDRAGIDVRVTLTRESGEVVIDFHHSSHAAKPPNGGNWIIRKRLHQGKYLGEIRLEGHLAYRRAMTLEAALM